MTPEDQAALTNHAREIGKILHRNTPKDTIQTLEGIEKTVRGQVLEHVSPEIALFLSKQKPDGEPSEADGNEKSSVQWGYCR
jgi:hypothetical protein